MESDAAVLRRYEVSRRRTTAVCVGVLLLGWGGYWFAFFPGVISHDVLVQWAEIQSGRYDDLHPAFHTFVLWLVTRVYPSLGAVGAVHVVLAAALAGHLLGTARGLGAPRWLVAVALAWLAASPVFGMNVIAVGRDSAFALALVWTTVLLVRTAERRTPSFGDGLVLGSALTFVCLLRHNGAALAVAVLAATAWCRGRRAWGTGAAAAVTCLLAVVIVRGPIYRLAAVAPMPPVVSQGYVIHQVAALVHARTELTDDEAAFLSALAPLPVWRAAYDCADSYPILYHVGLDVAPLRAAPMRLVGIWAALARRNPGALLAHWRCVTAFVWRYGAPVRIGPLPPNRDSAATGGALRRVVDATAAPHTTLHFLVWQPALALDVLLVSLAVALWRSRSRLPVLLWTPALANTLVWLAGIAPSPHLRYQWPTMLLAPLLMALSGVKWKGTTDDHELRAGQVETFLFRG